jgi:hypothetical protein
MRLCRFMTVWTVAMGFSLAWAGAARGEPILRLEHGSKPNTPPQKTKPQFQVQARKAPRLFTTALRNEPDFERFAPYLLNGNRDKLEFRAAPHRKEISNAGICWGDQHARKIVLKELKFAQMPLTAKSSHDVPPVPPEPAGLPEPRASLSAVTPSVPAPSAIWAGLGMIGLLAGRKWLAGRNATAL